MPTSKAFQAKPPATSRFKDYGSPQILKGKIYVHNVKDNFFKAVNDGGVINKINNLSSKALRETIKNIEKLIKDTEKEEELISKSLSENTSGVLSLDEVLSSLNSKKPVTQNGTEIDVNVFKKSKKIKEDRDISDKKQAEQLEQILAMYNLSTAVNKLNFKSIKTFENSTEKINEALRKYNLNKKDSDSLYRSSIMRAGILFEAVAGAVGQKKLEQAVEAIGASVKTDLVGAEGKLADIKRTIVLKNSIEIDIKEDVKLSEAYTNQKIYKTTDPRITNEYFDYLVYNVLALANVSNLWAGADALKGIKGAINRYINSKTLQYALVEGGVETLENYSPDTVILTTPYGSMKKSVFLKNVLKEVKKAEKELKDKGSFNQFGSVMNDIGTMAKQLPFSQKELFEIKDRKYKVAKGEIGSSGYAKIMKDGIIKGSYFDVVKQVAEQINFTMRVRLEIPKIK